MTSKIFFAAMVSLALVSFLPTAAANWTRQEKEYEDEDGTTGLYSAEVSWCGDDLSVSPHGYHESTVFATYGDLYWKPSDGSFTHIDDCKRPIPGFSCDTWGPSTSECKAAKARTTVAGTSASVPSLTDYNRFC